MLSIDTKAFDEYLKDNAKRNRQNDITNLSKSDYILRSPPRSR